MINVSIPDWFDLWMSYCKGKGKYAVCVSLTYACDTANPNMDSLVMELDRGIPFWRQYWKHEGEVLMCSISGAPAVFTMDTEEEMWHIFNQVRGDSGLLGDPTPGKFYACTFDPEGNMLCENT